MRITFFALASYLAAAWVCAQAEAEGALAPKTWTVDTGVRRALLNEPDGPGPHPIVFVFHGHGGNAAQASQSMPVHLLWPGALVVYPQGLPTPGQLTDPSGRQNGWSVEPGPRNRDLRFFDVMLAALESEHAVDSRRIYAMGHSNGGSFTYLLWNQRRAVFAAFGPSGAVAGREFRNLDPAPVIQVSGLSDPLVKYAWQARMVEGLLRVNHCGPGEPAGPNLTLYPSAIGSPVETFIHPGGHVFPTEATDAIVAFFKAHARP